jgi:hydrogenase maturation protease
MKRILIAGIGNILHRDDAFGVIVIRELLKHSTHLGVRIKDFGIRAYDLAYALTDGYDAVVLVDAALLGKAPGTVCLIEPEVNQVGELKSNNEDARRMNPGMVIQMASSLGYRPTKLFLVGCEPASLGDGSGDFGLSTPVQAAIPRALSLIKELVRDLLTESKPANNGLMPA